MVQPKQSSPAASLPKLLLDSALRQADEVLLIGVVSTGDDEIEPLGSALASGQADELARALRAVGAKGKAFELVRVPAPSGLNTTSVLAVGLGTREESKNPERVRRAAGVAARALSEAGNVATTLSELDLGATVEGFVLGGYRFDAYKTNTAKNGAAAPPDRAQQLRLLVQSPRSAQAKAELARARSIVESVAAARDFVNTPPNHLYPDSFAARVVALAKSLGVQAEVLDEKQLVKGGYGGVVGVGQGSSRPPRLVKLEYRGRSGKGTEVDVALVGKGVTFDTGGISIKPAVNMENMTSDMGGAAAVAGAVFAAAKLALPLNITATLPMVENMPSSTAQRPGDVITQYGGTTTLVINTDAEGRLILADGIVLACERKPAYLIDVATLTGAQMIALGSRTPGVMGTEDFRDRVSEISRSVGEGGWPMPLPEELADDLKSPIADLANVTNHRNGGMLSAALFLKEFVSPDVSWAHLDVAGPAYNTGSAHGYTPKGGTGVPVRTLVAVLEDIAERG
ncbi:Leucyl aminopeptidase [Segniliparus rotundus DSM 44985]|uniref:Probable cytosol aminopeptidase n=1 Tax=Segniliparus rotundus (strain ATCC BAA-972 / CDC 1076 / CIP 108378 / DSM 44985 / JCM 13578) TaxID=640132 RepID=D6Z9C1_SEGRD|nr:leucyl aminopeptidase [Segniliparus rotundus]ADG98551.1 Leucyl aminopeptidase [Segniliparus rotundus DSM 44985]